MSALSRGTRSLLRRNPFVQLRATVAGVAGVGGVVWLIGDHDAALGAALIAFAAFSGLALGYDMLIAIYADQSQPPVSALDELVKNNQTSVLTLTGTTLGLLAAFHEGALPLATRAAIVSLVGAALVQFIVQASGARHLGAAAWRIGLVGDLIAIWLLSFGLIALAASLVDQSGR